MDSQLRKMIARTCRNLDTGLVDLLKVLRRYKEGLICEQDVRSPVVERRRILIGKQGKGEAYIQRDPARQNQARCLEPLYIYLSR